MSSPDLGTRGLEERVQALSTWAGEIAERVRATEVATGDEKTAKELRRALELVAKHDPKLESRLTNRIDVLADRLGTLASAVSTTSSELARRDGEIAALRREHERDAARLQAFEQERTRGAPSTELAELRKAVATLSTAQSPRAADEHVARLVGKVDYLTERVDTLAKTVATTAAGLAGREGDLAALRQRLDERAGRLELGLRELGQRPPEREPDPRFEELAEELRQSVADVVESQSTSAHRLDSHETILARSALESNRIAELEGAVHESIASLRDAVEHDRTSVAARLAALTGDRDQITAELAHASAVVAERLEKLTGRIEEVERRDTAGAFEATLVKLEERLRAVEQTSGATAADVARVSASWVEELARIADKLEESTVVAVEASSRDFETERLLTDLGTRLDAIVHERQTVAAQIAQASENEVAELRTLIDGLRPRFASGEPDLESDADRGEGRLRLELRALELRSERAEKAAQQNRDAVLAQLDLLAGQIESRFQQLESEPDPSADPEEPAHAEVVPLRGAEV